MTENQWPEDPAYTAPPASTGIPGERSAATFPSAATPPYGQTQTGDISGASRKDAAREEAADVARTAKDSAQGVAQTAKEEAAHVASEAKTSAQDLLHQAKSGLTSQAGTQQQKAAEGIRSISSQLQSMAAAPDQQGVASDLVRQAASTTETVASWLETKQPGDLLGEVQRFARNRPGTFLLVAAGAGVLAGRLTRGLTAGAPESSYGTGTTTAGLAGQYPGAGYSGTQYGDQYTESYAPAGGTVPPPPVQLPGPATTTAGYDGGAPGSGYGEPTRPASALDSPQLVEEPWSGNRVADDPLGNRDLADDPMAGDPLTRDRSRDGQSGGL
ncbi:MULTISPECIES: hypothetical protein [Pseudarthrobacter]|uniref:hypothetical protein n=1 Tax=Pseudarthrobacter TaxID=1742993 RepID=UPI0012FC3421|nr:MULTISPECIES: hypothetical protein [Pseudarthrobacter]MUU71096.1 hypothetical protein [Pseudarthrobacter sp. GA104]WPU09879.1 hypothetical protein SMD14_02340 [Pseudarthrobacter oxydans]